MQIQWFGLGCFSISGKIGAEEVSCVTDPFTEKFGLRPPRSLQGNIAVRSHAKGYADNASLVQGTEEDEVFSITHAGEYESRGIFVNGIFAPTKKAPDNTMYRILFDGLSVGFLGVLDRPLKNAEIEALGDIHILIVPVGGSDVLAPAAAADVVSQVEPRVVIPAYYHTDGLTTEHGAVESFISSLGVTPERMDKYKISKSGLPDEDLGLVILNA